MMITETDEWRDGNASTLKVPLPIRVRGMYTLDCSEFTDITDPFGLPRVQIEGENLSILGCLHSRRHLALVGVSPGDCYVRFLGDEDGRPYEKRLLFTVVDVP